jgi:short chain dehydrogenase
MQQAGTAGGKGTVVVTGASRGFGREVALQAAAAGYPVIGLARKSPDLDSLAKKARSIHIKNMHDCMSRQRVPQTPPAPTLPTLRASVALTPIASDLRLRVAYRRRRWRRRRPLCLPSLRSSSTAAHTLAAVGVLSRLQHGGVRSGQPGVHGARHHADHGRHAPRRHARARGGARGANSEHGQGERVCCSV